MHSLGKEIRLKRLIRQETNSSVICALDHGMTSPTFLSGLRDMKARVREAQAGGANVFMLSKGFARIVVDELHRETSFAMMLSAAAAGCPKPNIIVEIGQVEEALRLGADAVVVYVALNGENEPEMIHFVARVGGECERLGMPFIAEAEYPSAYASLETLKQEYGYEYLLRNSRLCAELGADIVKTNWPGDPDLFAKIVQATQVPMVVAGGTLVSDEELLKRMELAMQAGAIGCSVGRNIFQHENPFAMTRALARVIHERWPAKDALEELRATLAQGKR
ncbi:MAG: fructose-bisphosphate aldolase [Anaerolineae bacterium]